MNTKLKNKKILITGAAGFIGFHLAKSLLEQNVVIVGLDNLNHYYDVSLKEARLELLKSHENFLFHKIDISDKASLVSLFEAEKFDYVVHLAAQAGVRYCIQNPDAYVNSNLIGQMNILEAIRKYPPLHTVYASSSSVYGNIEEMPFHTEMKTDSPVSLYAATKKSCELLSYSYSKMYDLYLTGLRFFTVYGAYGRPDMAYFKFTKSILEGKPIDVYNHGDMLRDFTYIDDIIAGVTACITLPRTTEVPHKIFNIGGSHPEKLSDMIEILGDLLGEKAVKNYLPMQVGDVYKTYADTNPLLKATGIKAQTNLKDGLKKFVDWYKSYYKVS